VKRFILDVRNKEEFDGWKMEGNKHIRLKVRQTNMGKFRPDKEQQRGMEINPNRCAV
jgi:hypothetical protein